MSTLNEDNISITNTFTKSANGKILINGQELNIYDDTEIKNILDSKANMKHTHTLSDIDDLDVTNKVNGSVITYDSSLDKFVSRSLSINPTSSATYLIELSRWGIKNDGTDATNTTIGINNALQWCCDNGYSQVFFPKGVYLIDEASSVKPKSFMTLNLNGSILKVRDNNLEIYSIVKFDNVMFSRITNGKILGDRDSHTYTSDGVGSDTHEGGIGINVHRNCRYISVDNLEISYTTGDAIVSGGTFPSLAVQLRQMQCEQGCYSLTDGNPISDGSRIRFISKIMMNDPEIISAGTWGVYGSGYGGLGSDITSDHYDVIYYKSDNTFHSSIEKVQFFDDLDVPVGASYAKISLYQDIIPTDVNNTLWVRCNSHPEKIFFERLNLHHCRRQGMSLSGKYIYIRDSEIHHIGGNTFQTGTDPQGGIDIEDGYDLNQHFYIERNHFHDNWGYDLVITNGKYMHINGNRFNKVGKYISVAMNAPIDRSFFINNFIHQGQVNIGGEFIVSKNHFYGANCSFGDADIFKKYGRSIELKDNIFHNCGVTINQAVPYTIIVDNCKFLNDKTKLSTFKSIIASVTVKNEPQIFRNCTFDGEDVSYPIYNPNNTKSGWIFDNISFKNITKNISFPPSTIRNCKFIDITNISFSTSAAINDGDIEILGCWIKSIDQNNALFIISNAKSFKVEDCYIEKKDSSLFIIQNISDRFILKGNTLRYPNAIFTNRNLFEIQSSFSGTLILVENNNIYSSLTRPFFLNSTVNIPQFIVRNNVLNGFVVNRNKEIFQNNFVGGIIDPYYKVTTIPTSGYYSLGQEIKNSSPISGGYLGWICVMAGVANNTMWSASATYSIGNLVNANNKVYKCNVAGISGATPPSHTSGTGTDGTVTWEYIDAKAEFKQFGAIQV